MVNVDILRIEPPPGNTGPDTPQPPPGPPAGPPPKVNPNLDRGRLYLIWIFQAVVLLATIAISWRVGASLWFLLPGILVFVLLCSWLGWLMWINASTPNPIPPGDPLLWFMEAGIWLVSLAFFLLAVATVQRIDWRESLSIFPGLFVIVFSCVVALVTFRVSRYAIVHGATPWLQFASGVTFLPLVAAWTLSSVVAWLAPRPSPATSAGVLEKQRWTELDKRGKWGQHRGWKSSDGRSLVIALALSGGGYRAAATHAGFLQALDERCVPIRYLTAVSGGSIIGAYYALGYSPSLFKEVLVRQKPRLPDDILSIWFVALEWWWPFWNSADTYSRHLHGTFFGAKALADTGLTPQLLVNATDLEGTSHPREVFYKGRNSQYPELDRTQVDDIVAASAAFPGAFQPKTISWPLPFTKQAPETRRFVDGGVVENFGYSGLADFLNTTGADAVRPDLFIISDASAEVPEGGLPLKVDFLKLLSRSQDISYWIQHNLLRSYLKDAIRRPEGLQFEAHLVRAQDDEMLKRLEDTWYAPPGSADKIRGDDIARKVGRYPTLKELEPQEVERAFWLGHTVGQVYWDNQLDRWRQKRSASISCPPLYSQGASVPR